MRPRTLACRMKLFVIAFVYLLFLDTTVKAARRTLMVIGQGSRFRAGELWDDYALNGFNDIEGDKSALGPIAISAEGDFRAKNDTTLDTPAKLCVEAYGTKNVLAKACFNIYEMEDTTVLDYWFHDYHLASIYPHETGIKTVACRATSLGEFDLAISDIDDETRLAFALQYNGTLSQILVPPGDPGFIQINVQGGAYHGCFWDAVLVLEHLYDDDEGMTPNECALTCDDVNFNYVAIQHHKTFGTFECYCANLLPATSLDSYCNVVCPGNNYELCGGSVSGYYSVYEKDVSISPITASQSQLLTPRVESIVNETHSVNDFSVVDVEDLDDSFLYVSGVSVLAFNQWNETTLFHFNSDTRVNTSRFNTTCGPYSEAQNYTTDGALIQVETLVARHFCVYFIEEVEISTVKLYGPDDKAYMPAEFVAVIGIWAPEPEPTSSSSYMPSSTMSSSLMPSSTMSSSLILSSTMSSSLMPSSTMSSSSMTSSSRDTSSSTTSMAMTSTAVVIVTVTSTSTVLATVTQSAVVNSSITLEERIAALTLDRKALASYSRQKTSAHDDRASAKTMGILGVMMVASAITLLVVLDYPRLVSELVRLKKNVHVAKKSLVKRLSQQKLTAIENIQLEENDDLPSVLSIYDDPVDSPGTK